MLLVQRPSSNTTEGERGSETGTEMERRERERGDNWGRQLKKADGKEQGPGQWMDGRNYGRRKTRDREKQRRSERLKSGGVKKSDPGHYPCSISAGQADGRLSAHYTS